MHARIRLSCLFGLLTLFGSCRASMEIRATSLTRGEILVMPTRNAVWASGPEATKGTGKVLGDYIVKEFSRLKWSVVLQPVNDAVGHGEPVAAETALQLGRKRGSKYVLTTTLGEMRDRAAFTPVLGDYATLDAAQLHDCANGDIVWELTAPFLAACSNIGDCSASFRTMAVRLARSIEQNAK